MYYREVINRLNDKFKKDKKILYFGSMELIGLSNLAVYILGNNNFINSSISSGIFSSTLASICVLYHFEKEEVYKEKYKEKNMDKYYELKELYDEYIDKVVNILSDIKYENNMQLCTALDYLLDTGFFSRNESYKYTKLTDKYEVYEDLFGTFIVEGNGVCRHNSVFISDILNKLNVKNLKIYCSNLKGRMALKYSNHVLLGLMQDDKKFVYDFTNNSIGQINREFITLIGINGKESKYHVIDKENNLEDYLSKESCELDSETLARSVVFGLKAGYDLKQKLGCMYDLEPKLMDEISEKSLKLMPRKK